MGSDGPHKTKRRRPSHTSESVTLQSLNPETSRDLVTITVNTNINAISFLQPHVNDACH